MSAILSRPQCVNVWDNNGATNVVNIKYSTDILYWYGQSIRLHLTEREICKAMAIFSLWVNAISLYMNWPTDQLANLYTSSRLVGKIRVVTHITILQLWKKTCLICWKIMMPSSNGDIFRTTGPLCGESTSDRWILFTKAMDAELWCFLWYEPEETYEQKIETPVILRRYRAHYDVTAMRRCHGLMVYGHHCAHSHIYAILCWNKYIPYIYHYIC